MPKKIALMMTVLAGFVLAAANADPLNYTFTTFNGPGDNAGGTNVNGVSNTGAIAGLSTNANMTVNTNFVRNPNGSLTALNINNDPLATANGINSSGIVVGGTVGQAFVLNSGLLSLVPPALPGETASETAFGINDHGVIVGQFVDNATDTVPGFVDVNGMFTVLNPVANDLQVNAQGINDQGEVVGFYSTDGQHDHGFLFNTLTDQYTLLPDPVESNLFLTQFLGINDNGWAVGYWQDNAGSQHGFLYNLNTKTFTFLDDPSAGINNGIEITQITGINDFNEIVGFYVDGNGVQRGFYANVAAPEPTLTGLIGLGLVAIVWRKRMVGARREVQAV
jgi:probable HAF family extracellular repeat protein